MIVNDIPASRLAVRSCDMHGELLNWRKMGRFAMRRSEAMHMIRKGQVRWLAKGDVLGQRAFVHFLFGIAT